MATANLGSMRIHYLIDDLTDPWRRPGEVKTVLMFHGSNRNLKFWTPWVSTIARYYRVLRLDAPGIQRAMGIALSRAAGTQQPLVERSLTAGRALFYYLGLLVWPRVPNALPLVPPITSPLDAWFLGAVAIIGGCVAAAKRWRHTRPELTFGVVFFLLSLIPVANLVALYPAAGIRFPVAERYMYLPSWAFIFVLAVLLWDSTRHAARRRHADSNAGRRGTTAGPGRP